MASERARPRAPPFIDPSDYARHRPEATLLYQLVERHYPEFVAVAACQPSGYPHTKVSRLNGNPGSVSPTMQPGARVTHYEILSAPPHGTQRRTLP